MIKIGITGQAGFIGTHLFNTLSLHPDKYIIIPFRDEFFQSEEALDAFVKQCDVIIHLAAMNRHNDPNVLYKTNIELVQKLIDSMERTNSKPYVIMSSSLQEERDNVYGLSKKEGRKLFNQWAERNGAKFTGLIIPNVFGPFGVPFYNSVISTFSHQICNTQEPRIEVDNELKLIYVGDLVKVVLDLFPADYANTEGSEGTEDTENSEGWQPPKVLEVPYKAKYKVSELLNKLQGYYDTYVVNGIFPDLADWFEVCLFNTFRSYIPKEHFPVKYNKHSDQRGIYVETMKFNSRGQVSFSTTLPGITRGNHFHTRKVERFAVIKGKASIKLRKYGTDEIIEYILDGEEPAYVDMPIWYTHNITNIGDTELLTMFWINEFYDPNDPDTYYEPV
ncbi:MAG TPA: NAD-dependent epimerase/dehydratase family protein [Candidatus Cloacimonas sp.]|nr:NAD-dependent epimerase/dehydratase family protein [Candidatus Cloacimonas sp.]